MLGLQLIRGGEVAMVHRVSERLVHIGRAAVNDLILSDARVSDHHAVIWRQEGRAWLRDLDSANGTFVNGQPLAGPRALEIGDQLLFGGTVLELTRLMEQAQAPVTLVLEDVESGVCLPLLSQRLRVGSGLDCDLILPDAPNHVLTLFVDGEEVWLGLDEGERAAELDVPFDAAGRAFVIRHSTGDETSTVVPACLGQLEYRIEASLDGPTGAFAVVTDLHSGNSHRIEAENRALLLYLLAKAFRDGRAAGESIHEAGWCSDSDLRTGLWGRVSGSNQLNVLLHRLRGSLREANLDPWFLEKRRRYTRARLTEVEIL